MSLLSFRFLFPFALSVLFAVASPAAAAVNIVASIPDLADMARIIGGDQVRVTSLATGREDLHAVPVRPSFIPKINRADLLLNLGYDAEHAWLPALAKEARNRRVMEGGAGWIEVGEGVPILERPEKWDRSEGHQHPLGNPHFNVGPHAGRIMAQNIAQALIQFDPENESAYRDRLNRYLETLSGLEAELREKGAPLRGQKIVAFHPDVAYLCQFYGMEKVGSIEPKPGIQPTGRHLESLAGRMNEENVRLILYNQAQNARLPERLARETGARAVEFANAVGAKPDIDSWIELQRYNLDRLLAALPESESP
ncbi:MAG: metal ABC transporter substrate-binding protein [Desulfococcaceae bacterium]